MRAGITLALPRRRYGIGGGAGAFTPAALFTTGVNGAWYDPSDMTTLFQGAAGTTPVTAMEQPVGLMLDKRDTTYSTYFDGVGDYLSLPTNQSGLTFGSGDFTVEAWVYRYSGTGIANILVGQSDLNSVAGSSWVFYVGPGPSALYSGGVAYTINSPNPTTGYWAHIAYVRNGGTFSSYLDGVRVGTRSDLGSLSINTGSTSHTPAIGAFDNGTNALNGYISNLRIVKGTALYTANFTPPTSPLTAVTGTSLLTCGTTWSGNPAITTVGNARADKLNPFKTGTGNHAFNSSGNSANFPVLSSRINLLLSSEDFASANWTKTSVTVTANVATAPDGTNTADLIYPSTSGTGRYVNRDTTGQTVGTSFTTRVSLKSAGIGFAYVYNVQGNSLLYVNLATGATSNVGANISNLTSSVDANGWVTVSFTSTLTVGATAYCYVGPCDASGSTQVTANGTSGIYIWGADLRATNDALNQPAYQRVNTATDYDTVGFKPYLSFNGVNQWLQTNSIDFTYGDKMFVSAGVRKLSDAGRGIIAELSTVAVNPGTLYFAAPDTNGSANYGMFLDGNSYVQPSGYASPITNVVTVIFDRASSNKKVASRFNAVNGPSTAGNPATTGNFGDYPFDIGARGGTSLWFNGRLYQMVFAGKQASASEIASTESWLNQKTGAY